MHRARNHMEKTPTKVWNEFEDFNVGDVVRLKSGGPNMTVENASGSRIVCVWFDSEQCFIRKDIDQGALEKVVPESPSASL